MNREFKLKILKRSIIAILLVAIIFTIGMIILTYQVEGETNLPFQINKIVIVSSSEGIEKTNSENMWSFDINQNNDIYLYIQKNDSYGRTEIIKEIKLDNFQILEPSKIGKLKMYKPSLEGIEIFYNTENNQAKEIIYTGELQSNIKEMKISNQGGLVVFRCANDKVGEYLSNDGTEINYNALLGGTSITNEQLKATISFDITIDLISNKTYNSTITLELPVGDIVNNPNANLEITDLNDIVFKRIEN